MIKADKKNSCVAMDGTIPELCADAEIILRSLSHYFNNIIPGLGDKLVRKIFEESAKGDGPEITAMIDATELAKQLKKED